MKKKIIATLIALSLTVGGVYACLSLPRPVDMEIDVEVELGADGGQQLGTLWSMNDDSGKPVMAAGFLDVYNNHNKSDNRKLNVYIKTDRAGSFEELGKPFEGDEFGHYVRLFEMDGELIAYNPVTNESKIYDEVNEEWDEHTETTQYVQKVNDKYLRFYSDNITYDGDDILDYSGTDSISAYYVDGKMHAYVGGATRTLYVCNWMPGDDPIDFAECEEDHYMTYPYNQGVMSWGQCEDEVLYNMNYGDRWRYFNGAITRIFENNFTSNQVYFVMKCKDEKVFAGQYPSGKVLTYSGSSYSDMNPNIAVPSGYPTTGREAQTAAMYAGYMFVGEWPHGEFHKFDFDANTWQYVQRLFTHPTPSTSIQEPYKNQLVALGSPVHENAFGQRIIDMLPIGDSLYIMTANKQGDHYLSGWGFMNANQLKEYGRVVKYKKDYNIACDITWSGTGTTTLGVKLDNEELSLYQDENILCSTEVELTGVSFDEDSLTLKDGLFGKFRGEDITLL